MKVKVLEELNKNDFFVKRLLKLLPAVADKLNSYNSLKKSHQKDKKEKTK